MNIPEGIVCKYCGKPDLLQPDPMMYYMDAIDADGFSQSYMCQCEKALWASGEYRGTGAVATPTKEELQKDDISDLEDAIEELELELENAYAEMADLTIHTKRFYKQLMEFSLITIRMLIKVKFFDEEEYHWSQQYQIPNLTKETLDDMKIRAIQDLLDTIPGGDSATGAEVSKVEYMKWHKLWSSWDG